MKAVQERKVWEKERDCKNMNYVGIDIHKKHSVLAAVDEHGKELARGRVEGNMVAGFARFFGALPGESKVALEACWNWGLIHDVFIRYGKTTLPRGTRLKIVSRNGNAVTVVYLDQTVSVPITSTDLQS
jgi:hypothetical protein